MNVQYRKAKRNDLKEIISLLADDPLGRAREQEDDGIDEQYFDAFAKIDNDPNQYLMVLENDSKVMGTCHLTLMPSLTFLGSTRLQIEAVRVNANVRGQNLGQKMIQFAISWGKSHGATITQLTTNKERPKALRFYEKLGFEASHEGMKLYLK